MKKAIILFSAFYLSGCFVFHGSKKQEPVEPPIVSVEEKAPEVEPPKEESPELTPSEPKETNPTHEETPSEPSKQLSYQEKIIFLRNYLIENQNGDNNLHTYQIENRTLHVALPVKKDIFGRKDLLFTEVIENDQSIAYVHFPEDEYPNAALSGNPGILESLLRVYEKGEGLEWHIYWNYTVNRPPTQEQIQKYELTISELERLVGNK